MSRSGARTPGRGLPAFHGGRRYPARIREIEDVTSVSKMVVNDAVLRLSVLRSATVRTKCIQEGFGLIYTYLGAAIIQQCRTAYLRR